ncbi:GNAT family protein [Shewanella sp. Isolate11]|uniref:GNAT family N-acetyltransferase n=1 Tax=Shewanella sp. Isolate11 TaxID=2908530 RepID=UPI001EFCBA9C|nr:GNAT family N-acetyltransferase [Shewanella sp. Isolate11]
MNIFTTTRILCREFETEDLRPFSLYRADPKVAQYQSWSDYSYQDALGLFEQMQRTPFATPDSWVQLALECRETRQLLGDLALHFIDDQQMEIGFTLAPQFQHQGYATEAVNGLLYYLFIERGVRRIVATTDCDNRPSWSLLERVGFRREAHHIENIFFKGQWGSEFVYAILASEFAAAQ